MLWTVSNNNNNNNNNNIINGLFLLSYTFMSEKNLRINVMNLHVEHNVSIVKWRMHSTLITVTCLASHAATKNWCMSD